MRWTHVADNWEAFHAPILQRWPEAEENALIRIAGDRQAFLGYIAELTGQTPADVADDLRTWLEGEVPADVVMDPHHDNASIAQSARFVPPGEDPSDDDARFGDDDKTEPPVGRD